MNDQIKSKQSTADQLKDEIFPKISSYFRLFKTPQGRQDEYIQIQPVDPSDVDRFQPTIYRIDRDVVDILAAIGVPTTISYLVVENEAPKYKKINVFSEWRKQPVVQRGRLTGYCYIPGGAQIVRDRLNTFKDVSVQAVAPPTKNALDDILHHIKHNICNGRGEYADYVIKWLAHMIQRPAVRPKTAVAIIGDQGTGKGILVDFIKLMLGGERNCNTTASSTDTKAFNYALTGKLFVVFDEATFAGDRSQSDFMKKFVTEPRIRVEQKGVDAYEVENFVRAMITSNNMTSAVPANLGARRWLMVECRNNVDADWLKMLATKIGNNGQRPGAEANYAAWFKHHLESIDLSDFDTLNLPMQDTGYETKLSVLYREDCIKAFIWEWLKAADLTLYQKTVVHDKDSGTSSDVEVPLRWQHEVLFTDFYNVLAEHCKVSFAQLPGRNRIRDLLEPYDLEVVTRKGNVRMIALPHPKICLQTLRKSARFDNPISPEQEDVINHARDWIGEVPENVLLRFNAVAGGKSQGDETRKTASKK